MITASSIAALANVFKWGSVRPKPPLDRLEQIAGLLDEEERSVYG